MNTLEAIEAAKQGKRLTAPILSKGAVLRCVDDDPVPKVYFETSGDYCDFCPEFYPTCDNWRIIEGWLMYGS